MDITFDEVVKLAEQLDAEHQNLLIYRLRVKQLQERTAQETVQPALSSQYSNTWIAQRGTESYHSPTREELIRGTEILRSTPVGPDNSLHGKYANPHLPEMSEEAFHAQMHAIATEWEQELDDLASDKS